MDVVPPPPPLVLPPVVPPPLSSAPQAARRPDGSASTPPAKAALLNSSRRLSDQPVNSGTDCPSFARTAKVATVGNRRCDPPPAVPPKDDRHRRRNWSRQRQPRPVAPCGMAISGRGPYGERRSLRRLHGRHRDRE